MATADRRAQERARRKEDILAAARSVFGEAGWRRATVDAVAERAQVSKGTIYLYFESKEAILADLVLQALTELSDRLREACDSCPDWQPQQRLQAMADAYRSFADAAPDYFRLLNAYNGGSFQEGVSHEQQNELLDRSRCTLDLVSEVIEAGMARGTFARADAQQMAGVLWASLNGALALMAHPIRRGIVPAGAHDLYQTTLEVFLRGLARNGMEVSS